MQIKSWQSHQINEILPRKFCGTPAKPLREKNKACLGFEVCCTLPHPHHHLDLLLLMYRVSKKNCVFPVHCNPSLACILL